MVLTTIGYKIVTFLLFFCCPIKKIKLIGKVPHINLM